jgi:hypothetical protein
MQPGLVSPVFVGRGAELSSLVAGLESATASEPAVVLVGGEAGVGKTRLVEEAATRARRARARVLTGSCIEVGGEGLPLGPVVDALRSLMRQTRRSPKRSSPAERPPAFTCRTSSASWMSRAAARRRLSRTVWASPSKRRPSFTSAAWLAAARQPRTRRLTR